MTGPEEHLTRLTEEGIEHEPIETYSNGVRHVNVPDPDGNALAFAEAPEAEARWLDRLQVRPSWLRSRH